MALFALDRTFVPGCMAGNAKIMSGLFTPIIDLADLGDVAVKALVIQDLLVLPVHKRKNQVSHFKFDDFRAAFLRKQRHSPKSAAAKKMSSSYAS
jgi:hypothetical protein